MNSNCGKYITVMSSRLYRTLSLTETIPKLKELYGECSIDDAIQRTCGYMYQSLSDYEKILDGYIRLQDSPKVRNCFRRLTISDWRRDLPRFTQLLAEMEAYVFGAHYVYNADSITALRHIIKLLDKVKEIFEQVGVCNCRRRNCKHS
jgi:hypothetical protein